MVRAAALRPLLERACSRNSNVTPDELICAAERRDAVLWLVLDGNVPVGACATRLARMSADEPHFTAAARGRLALETVVAGGTGGLVWAPSLRKRLHEFREASGADLLFVWGRKGWGRLFNLKPVAAASGLFLFEDWG